MYVQWQQFNVAPSRGISKDRNVTSIMRPLPKGCSEKDMEARAHIGVSHIDQRETLRNSAEPGNKS